MGLLDMFREKVPVKEEIDVSVQETAGASINKPRPPGNGVVLRICPNCGTILGLDSSTNTCCAGVAAIRAEAHTVKTGPDGKAIAAVRL